MAKDRFDHLFIAPSDFDRAVAFYREGLGWRTVTSWGGPSEPRGVILDGGGVEIVLAERHPTEDHSWSGGVSGQRPTLHLVVDDLEGRFQEVAAHVEVVVKPETAHWGTRWFVVKDPDNNLIAYEQRSSGPTEP